ncbi:MAG: hypothetical protein EPN91_08345 [Salinibacterium sp.]|nr:MAG: hypothetical protein EPN91_08345 [Salinibacterium sp.]
MSVADEAHKLLLQQLSWEKLEAAKPIIREQLSNAKPKMSAVEFEVVSGMVNRVLKVDSKEKWDRLSLFACTKVIEAFDAIMKFEEGG